MNKQKVVWRAEPFGAGQWRVIEVNDGTGHTSGVKLVLRLGRNRELAERMARLPDLETLVNALEEQLALTNNQDLPNALNPGGLSNNALREQAKVLTGYAQHKLDCVSWKRLTALCTCGLDDVQVPFYLAALKGKTNGG